MKFLVSLCFLFCLTLIGCTKSSSSQVDKWRAPSSRVKVLCTTPIIDDLVSRIGGDRIDHLSLMSYSIDPHSYELVKGDDEKFFIAQIIFYNGLGLEHSASLKTHLTKHPHAFAIGDHIRLENPLLILQDRGQIDPHIWLDVSIWQKAVDPIVTHLVMIDPAGREYYEQQGSKVKQELLDLDAWIYQQLQAIPSQKRYLVTSHDAFNYFARRYLHEKDSESWKDRFCAPEGLAPDGQLGFQDLQRVIDHLQKYQIEILFPESNVSQDSLNKIVEICRQKGLSIRLASSCLFSDTFSESPSKSNCYEDMMRHNVLVLCEGWKNHECSRR